MLKTIHEYSTIDKSDWGEGPWQNEPDKIEMVDEETGYPCMITRNGVGAFCGYVGIPKGHALFGKTWDWDSVDPATEIINGLNVHWGINYTSFRTPVAAYEREKIVIKHRRLFFFKMKITHYLKQLFGLYSTWWLGFDCAHAFDLMPSTNALLKSLGMDLTYERTDVYRDIDYLKAQITNLAKQLKEAE